MLSQRTASISNSEPNCVGTSDARRPLPDDADVGCALTTTARIVLDVELDLLPFLERVELARSQSGMMEENLAAVVGADESEAAVANEAHYWASCHDV
jgi:hypothetical protein